MTGGFVGLLGIYLGFVQEVSLAGGGVGSFVVRGTQDLSGQFAALGAIVAFAGGGAMLLMGTERRDARINRWATMAAGVGPVFLLAFSAAGLSARTQRSSQRRR